MSQHLDSDQINRLWQEAANMYSPGQEVANG
jgi:hypothetical protein